jgi:hypothetical protein
MPEARPPPSPRPGPRLLPARPRRRGPAPRCRRGPARAERGFIGAARAALSPAQRSLRHHHLKHTRTPRAALDWWRSIHPGPLLRETGKSGWLGHRSRRSQAREPGIMSNSRGVEAVGRLLAGRCFLLGRASFRGAVTRQAKPLEEQIGVEARVRRRRPGRRRNTAPPPMRGGPPSSESGGTLDLRSSQLPPAAASYARGTIRVNEWFPPFIELARLRAGIPGAGYPAPYLGRLPGDCDGPGAVAVRPPLP